MFHHYKFLLKLFNFNTFDIQVISFWSTFISCFIAFSNNFLGISAGLFALLFLIMITDYVTGLTASKIEERERAKKEDRKPCDIFSSKKGLGWVFKFGSYIIFLYFSMQLNIFVDNNVELEYLKYVTKVAHFYILLHIFYWELKSVDENFERIGYDFKIFDIFENIFRLVKGLLENKMNKKSE